MKATSQGGSAFPTMGMDFRNGQHVQAVFDLGMTLRDYFAAKAMQGLLSGLLANGMDLKWDGVAVDAYREADAMLKARV